MGEGRVCTSPKDGCRLLRDNACCCTAKCLAECELAGIGWHPIGGMASMRLHFIITYALPGRLAWVGQGRSASILACIRHMHACKCDAETLRIVLELPTPESLAE